MSQSIFPAPPESIHAFFHLGVLKDEVCMRCGAIMKCIVVIDQVDYGYKYEYEYRSVRYVCMEAECNSVVPEKKE